MEEWTSRRQIKRRKQMQWRGSGGGRRRGVAWRTRWIERGGGGAAARVRGRWRYITIKRSVTNPAVLRFQVHAQIEQFMLCLQHASSQGRVYALMHDMQARFRNNTSKGAGHQATTCDTYAVMLWVPEAGGKWQDAGIVTTLRSLLTGTTLTEL